MPEGRTFAVGQAVAPEFGLCQWQEGDEGEGDEQEESWWRWWTHGVLLEKKSWMDAE